MANRDDTNRGAGDPRSAALGAEAGSLPLPVGTVLERGFVIRSVLGRGGFGVTYMAEHTGLGKRFTLKEHFPERFAVRDGVSVRATSSGSAMFRWGLDRFLEEARRLAQFKHACIVDVTDVFEANGTAYMALAYEDGETLGKWLERLGRPPTQAEIDRILAPILDALEHVHSHEILHRDIAPDNIMIRRDGTPVLIDFGAARQAMAERSHTLTGIVKHGYSPPEQYTRAATRHGPWSDIYALGATLYRALTGAAPQEATDRVLGDQVEDLAGLAAQGYRPAFLAGIMAALALQPAERPQSVAAWRRALLPESRSAPVPRSIQRSRPTIGAPFPEAASRPTSDPRVAATPPSRPEQPPSGLLLDSPPPRKSGAMMGILVLVLILLAGGGFYAFTSDRSEEVRRLAEIRREIAAATTSETLDRIARGEPKVAPEITKRREVLAAIARAERVKLLREQVDRETSIATLDRIAAEAPELKPDIERRKAELAAEAKAVRLRRARERIAISDLPGELDRIAAEEPELRPDVEARKLALVRAAREARIRALRERIAAATDDAELDRIAAEMPELASAAQARKAELARLRTEQEEAARKRAEEARLARVRVLRERIAATSNETELDRIAAETPELASVVQARKAELVRIRAEREEEARKRAEQTRLAKVRAMRERIAATSDEPELDRIAAETPELASAVQQRKVELARARVANEEDIRRRAESEAKRRVDAEEVTARKRAEDERASSAATKSTMQGTWTGLWTDVNGGPPQYRSNIVISGNRVVRYVYLGKEQPIASSIVTEKGASFVMTGGNKITITLIGPNRASGFYQRTNGFTARAELTKRP